MKIKKIEDNDSQLIVEASLNLYSDAVPLASLNGATVLEEVFKIGWLTSEEVVRCQGPTLNNKNSSVIARYILAKKQKTLSRKKAAPKVNKGPTKKTTPAKENVSS